MQERATSPFLARPLSLVLAVRVALPIAGRAYAAAVGLGRGLLRRLLRRRLVQPRVVAAVEGAELGGVGGLAERLTGALVCHRHERVPDLGRERAARDAGAVHAVH